MKRNILYLGCCLLPIILMSSCATVPAPGKVGIPVQQFYLNNTGYLPIVGLCSYYNISWNYDSIGRQVILRKDENEAKLLIDSPMALVNGLPVDLESPVITYNGAAAVPFRFKEKVIDRFYSPGLPGKSAAHIPARKIRRVVVDAGHGGHDPGAIGRTGLREKDVNLDIARRLAKLLEEQGIEAVMTRSSDRFIALEGRADITNKANADIFVSVHSNASRSNKLNGFEVYYITDKINDSSRAVLAAKNAQLNINADSFYGNSFDLKATLWDMLYADSRMESIRIARSICETAERNMGLKILGVKGASFYVLKGSHIPAVLIEVGFVSNPAEERYLRNGFYRQQIAEAIRDGLMRYGRQYELAGKGN